MPVEALAPPVEPLAAEPLAQMIDPARTALAVIDIQGDFAAPDGAMAKVGCDFSDVEVVIDRSQALIAAARKAGATVMFARVVTTPQGDAPNLKAFYRRKGYPEEAVGVCRAGTPGADYYRVKPEPWSSSASQPTAAWIVPRATPFTAASTSSWCRTPAPPMAKSCTGRR